MALALHQQTTIYEIQFTITTLTTLTTTATTATTAKTFVLVTRYPGKALLYVTG